MNECRAGLKQEADQPSHLPGHADTYRQQARCGRNLFAGLDHATAHARDLRVMRQYMYAAVAAAEKRAEQPAHERDNDGPPERAAKAVDVETGHDTRHDEQHQAVYDENEKTKRQQNQRRAQQQQHRPHKSVQDPEQKRGGDERRDGIVSYAVQKRRGNHHRNGGRGPAKNEVPHTVKLPGTCRRASTTTIRLRIDAASVTG
jgi:hypothetical protein